MSPFLNSHYVIRFSFSSLNFKVRNELFKNSFFPYTVNEWNNLDIIIKWYELYLIFRKRIINLIRPKCNEAYRIHNPNGLKLLTSHKFNHNFRDCSNPLCSCSLSVGNNVHLFCIAITFQCKNKPPWTILNQLIRDLVNIW